MSESNNGFQQKSSAFLSWLTQRGASISPNIELADLRYRNAGRGVVATTTLPPDTELFRIPRSLILTPATATPLPPLSLSLTTPESPPLSDPWLNLILALVLEIARPGPSPWKPYLDLLPTTFDTPMFWTAAELASLQGSALPNKIGKTSADARFTTDLLPRIRARLGADTATTFPDAELLRWCHRMGSVIMAYAFDLDAAAGKKDDDEEEEREGEEEEDGWKEDDEDERNGAAGWEKGMVPLADMLNADAHRNNAKLYYEDDGAVVMKTVKEVGAREELLNDYGPLPRADVLRRYGYVTGNYAQYDVVEISLEMIKKVSEASANLSAKEVGERTEYLDEQGILDDAYDVARPESEDGPFPDELCALLNVLTISKEDFDKMKRKDKVPKPELSDMARQLLYNVLVHRYAMYPDSGTTSRTDCDPRRLDMATAVINGEKEVLQAAANIITQGTSNGKKRKAETLEEEAHLVRNANKK